MHVQGGKMSAFTIFQLLSESVCALPQDKAKAPQLQEAAERWSPYRSLASWYMWRVPTDKTPKKVRAKPAAVDKAPDV